MPSDCPGMFTCECGNLLITYAEVHEGACDDCFTAKYDTDDPKLNEECK